MEATTAAGIQDQFLNLLTTQLRHQDPLEPTKQEDFIAQLAQFSTLEGIEKLNANMSEFMETQAATQHDQGAMQAELQQFQLMASAADLVGKEVGFTRESQVDEANEQATGIAESVVLKDNAIHLRIGEELIRLDHIQEIGSRSSNLADLPILTTDEPSESNLPSEE